MAKKSQEFPFLPCFLGIPTGNPAGAASEASEHVEEFLGIPSLVKLIKLFAYDVTLLLDYTVLLYMYT